LEKTKQKLGEKTSSRDNRDGATPKERLVSLPGDGGGSVDIY